MSNNKNTISIIIPNLNQGKYIEKAILSVIKQNYKDKELIIIDGESKDKSIEIIEKYKNYISYFVSEKDSGQSEAINKGLKKANGNIVTWLCADDELLPGTLDKVSELFSIFKDDLGFLFGGAIVQNESKKTTYYDYGYEEINIERILAGMAFPQPACFFAKKAIEEVGYLNENYHYGMDYDLISRICLKFSWKRVKELFALINVHQDCKGVKNDSSFIDEWINIFLNILIELEKYELLDILKKLNFELKQRYLFGFNFNFDILKKINESNLLFYFLSNVIKSYYRNNRVEDAYNLMGFLKKTYSKEIIYEEKGMKELFFRLNYLPIKLIKFLKKYEKRY